MSRARDLADSADLAFDGNTLKIDSTNNRVGIGTDSPDSNAKVTIDTGTDNGALFLNSTDGDVNLSMADNAGHVRLLQAGGALAFRVGGAANSFGTGDTERMRIDSSGNLLVGKTSSGGATVGAELRPAGDNVFTRASGQALTLRRNNSDGAILEFSKDGTTVGSIGVDGDLYLNSQGSTGYLRNAGTTEYIWSASTFRPNGDNTNDLGAAGDRFKDLYLSGGVYLGGTGSANYLDDYEEGTWTPSLQDSGGSTLSGITYTTRSARYTKIGRMVNASCYVRLGSASTDSSSAYLASLPFTISNTDNTYYRATITTQNVSSSLGGSLYFEGVGGTNKGQMRLQNTAGNVTSLTSNSYLGSGSWVMVNVSYFTDS